MKIFVKNGTICSIAVDHVIDIWTYTTAEDFHRKH
jgi:hypothetical protein